jgi:hypothetical protein
LSNQTQPYCLEERRRCQDGGTASGPKTDNRNFLLAEPTHYRVLGCGKLRVHTGKRPHQDNRERPVDAAADVGTVTVQAKQSLGQQDKQ